MLDLHCKINSFRWNEGKRLSKVHFREIVKTPPTSPRNWQELYGNVSVVLLWLVVVMAERRELFPLPNQPGFGPLTVQIRDSKSSRKKFIPINWTVVGPRLAPLIANWHPKTRSLENRWMNRLIYSMKHTHTHFYATKGLFRPGKVNWSSGQPSPTTTTLPSNVIDHDIPNQYLFPLIFWLQNFCRLNTKQP